MSAPRFLVKQTLLLVAMLFSVWMPWGESTSAFDRSNFPIKVYINPDIIKSDGAVVAPLSEGTMGLLRRGILDWALILFSSPDKPTANSFGVILNRNTPEAQDKLFLEAGIFQFVSDPSQADLKIEGLDVTFLSGGNNTGGAIGWYFPQKGLKVGRIQLAIRQFISVNTNDEFTLRLVLVHEVGHALGLDHADGNCNLMSPVEYACYTYTDLGDPKCSSDAKYTRCIGILIDQVRFIEKQITAEVGRGPNSPFLDREAYFESLGTKVRAELKTDPSIKHRGQLRITVTSQGTLQDVSIAKSFDSPEEDALVLGHIKKLAPFAPFPSSTSQSNMSFQVSYYPFLVRKQYFETVRQRILAKLPEISPLQRPGTLHVEINGEGNPVDIKVTSSFGSTKLDEEIVNLAKRLAPYGSIPQLEAKESFDSDLSFGPPIPPAKP